MRNIGDAVWYPTTESEKRSEPCPLCLGEGNWETVAPNGHGFSLDCPECSRGYSSDGLRHYHVYTPCAYPSNVERIEQKDGVIKYSGRGFYGLVSLDLFDDRDSALERAAQLAVERTANQLEAISGWKQTIKRRSSVYRHRMTRPYDYSMQLEEDTLRLRDVLKQIDDPRARAVLAVVAWPKKVASRS